MKATPLRTLGRARPRRDGRHRPVWLIIELVVALAVIGVVGYFGFAFVLYTIGVIQPQHTRRAGDLAATAGLVLLDVLATRWMISIEHRLRTDQPVARSFADRHARPRFGWRGRRDGPVARVGVLLGVLGALTATIAGTVHTHAEGARSSHVQKDGILAPATVLSVHNVQYCWRSCGWTATIPVALARPVDGLAVTTVHFDAHSYLVVGARLDVRVDPRDPSYAELPGSPFRKRSAWLFPSLFALIFALIAAYDLEMLVRQLAHRRRHRATLGPRR